MSAELLVIFIVALFVFKPKHMPMLARHLGLLYRKFQVIKAQLLHYGQQGLAQLQLQENEEKANQADLIYKNKNQSSNNT